MRSSELVLFTPASSPPTVGYSQVSVVAASGLAFISGQVGVDENWRLADGLEAQTEQVFRNLRAAVEACGATRQHIAKLTIFAVKDADLAVYCAVRDRFFAGQKHLPGSTFVRVAGLYSPEALIEIEAVVALQS